AECFEIAGASGRGSRTTIRFGYQPPEISSNGAHASAPTELELAITPGEMVRPVLARVIGALAARAEFSVDRLADTVLLGDAVSSSEGRDFSDVRVGVSIRDGDGRLTVRVGPLVEGGGDRLLSEMELPGAGSLRRLGSNTEGPPGKKRAGRAP